MKYIILLLNVIVGITLNANTIIDSDSILSDSIPTVTVTAEKKNIRSSQGTMIVDLPTIVKDKPVTNILEALGYLPGVTSDNGMIGLSGASAVTILINGESMQIPLNNLYQLLYSMPVGRLKNVEIMYNAPAKYHVSGAIININLKTPGILDGLQGQANIGYNQKHYASFGGSLAATYASKRWTFDLNYSISRTNAWKSQEITSNHTIGSQLYPIREEDHQQSKNLHNSLYLSTAYKISDNSDLRLTYNMQYTTGVDDTNLSSGTFGDFTTTYSSPRKLHNVGIVYNSSFGMKIGGDYTFFDENNRQSMISTTDRSELIKATSSQRINKTRFYIDQSHKINNWGLNYGLEYRYANDDSRQTYTLPDNDGFAGKLIEQTFDAYVGTEHNFPFGLSFNASLKGEYYKVLDDTHFSVIPQLSMTYYKTPTSIFQLGFNSQKVYPPYWALHSGISHINDYSKIVGNPNLRPYTNYSTQLSYIFRQKYVATLYFNSNDNYFEQLPYQSPDELSLIYQTINFNYNNTLGINLHIPVSVKTILNSSLTVNAYYNRIKADHYHDISFDRDKATIYTALRNTIKFSEKCPIALSIDASYISPSMQGLADLSELWRLDAGVKWTFGKGNAELTLQADDIFNTWSPTMSINQFGQNLRTEFKDVTRNLRLTFTYRFNGFKPKQTAVDTSRFGTK